MECPWCGVETRPTFARCIECGRDIHRGPPLQTVLPPGTAPFSATADCTLVRRRHDSGLCYFDPAGLLQATVAEGAAGSTRCRSLGGDDVFTLEEYAAGPLGSFVVLDPDDGDRPLGTYVVAFRLPELVVDVRDDADAPVGRLCGATATFVVEETGGCRIAAAERQPVELDEGWIDDRWTLDVASEPATLDRRVLVACLLVCHRLVSTGPRDTTDS